MLAGYVPEVVLPAITCPVLLLQADPAAGGMLSDAEVNLALELLPRPTHLRLPGIGHLVHSTHPRQVLEAITSFAVRI